MDSRLDMSSKLAMDAQSLVQLRAQARQSPDQALKAAAQQFESVFLNMMIKSMREATPQDGMFDSEQTRMFTGMLDQQLAQNMAHKGIGLAEIMVKQLSHTMKTEGQPASVQQDFVGRMLPHALQAGQASGVPPQLMLGQAALESGWGRHEIRMADGSNSHNLFGIKAGAGWHGKTTTVFTTEYVNGVANRQAEKFRAYSSYADAFQDYADLIGNSPRYAEVLQRSGDAAGMAQAMQKAGYATDPQYADKLARVLEMTGDLLANPV